MSAPSVSRQLRMRAPAELRRTLQQFGGNAELRLDPPPGREQEAARRLDRAASTLAAFDALLSRFDPGSELSRLNRDPRAVVPASALMARFVEAARWAGAASGGLVDATCLREVERAGYGAHLAPDALDAGAAEWAAAARPAGALPDIDGSWRDLRLTGDGEIARPPGLRLDSGGIGKGLAADLAAAELRGAPAWMVDCGGDLRIGGTAGRPRAIAVLDPIDRRSVLHELRVTRGAVATSGVTRRAWLDPSGGAAHHLIDPRTGRPARTGILQVTALAPTGLEAEVRAKTALLSGLEAAAGQLPHGGVIIDDRGVVAVVPAGGLRQVA